MKKRKILIKNPTGLHARPARRFVSLTQNFKSKLQIINGTIVVEPKSIFSVLSGELRCGVTVEVMAEGPDEEEAIESIYQFIDSLEE